jgi:hypothetical protein
MWDVGWLRAWGMEHGEKTEIKAGIDALIEISMKKHPSLTLRG